MTKLWVDHDLHPPLRRKAGLRVLRIAKHESPAKWSGFMVVQVAALAGSVIGLLSLGLVASDLVKIVVRERSKQ